MEPDIKIIDNDYSDLQQAAKALGLEMRDGIAYIEIDGVGKSIDLRTIRPDCITRVLVREVGKLWYEQGQKDIKDSLAALIGVQRAPSN